MGLTIKKYAVKYLLYILERLNDDVLANISYANSSIRKVNTWQILYIYKCKRTSSNYNLFISLNNVLHNDRLNTIIDFNRSKLNPFS